QALQTQILNLLRNPGPNISGTSILPSGGASSRFADSSNQTTLTVAPSSGNGSAKSSGTVTPSGKDKEKSEQE
ncbi:MAG: hypothetical protein NT070_10850, partial [Cyanobacteria bacterium]|nr:hypothetical protein [Cyanobacteriota bacterium]